MKNHDKMRVYAWLEFAIWLVIVAALILGLRIYHHKTQKEFKNYQIFMEDVDGLIVGSPVKFLGVQIGYVKKIQILTTDVYIKFAITQKDLVLPTGAIATVEASGLGGSKALEIYPPDKSVPIDKIIQVKEPTRLSKVMGLFDSIFRELDAIITTINHAAGEFNTPEQGSAQRNVITIADTEEKIEKFDKSLDNMINVKNKFMKNFKKKNGNSGQQ